MQVPCRGTNQCASFDASIFWDAAGAPPGVRAGLSVFFDVDLAILSVLECPFLPLVSVTEIVVG